MIEYCLDIIYKLKKNIDFLEKQMTSKDDFGDSRRISRTKSMLGDSFKMGASLLHGLTGSGKNIRHLTIDSTYNLIYRRESCR